MDDAPERAGHRRHGRTRHPGDSRAARRTRGARERVGRRDGVPFSNTFGVPTYLAGLWPHDVSVEADDAALSFLAAHAGLWRLEVNDAFMPVPDGPLPACLFPPPGVPTCPIPSTVFYLHGTVVPGISVAVVPSLLATEAESWVHADLMTRFT